MIKIFQFIDSNISRVLLFISGFCCLISMLLITADVTGRYFFSSPIPGTLEATEFMLCMIVFGPLAYVESKGEHVRILFIYSHLPKKGQYVLSIFGKALGLVFFGIMAWETFLNAMQSYAIGESTWGEVPLPLWIGKGFISLGCFVYALHLLGSLGRELRGNEQDNPNEQTMQAD